MARFMTHDIMMKLFPSVQLGILAAMLCLGVCGYLMTEIKFA